MYDQRPLELILYGYCQTILSSCRSNSVIEHGARNNEPCRFIYMKKECNWQRKVHKASAKVELFREIFAGCVELLR